MIDSSWRWAFHDLESTVPPEKPGVANGETPTLKLSESHCQQETQYEKTVTALEVQLTEMEDVKSTTLNELENVRSSSAFVEENTSGKIHDLEAQLAEDRTRSKRLEQRLTPFLLVAVANGTL